jgi:DNA polymerase elongation subunit (family B)
MTVDEFAALIKTKPYLRRMGKGSLSKRYHISPEDVVKAKNLAYIGKNTPKILIFDIETAPIKAYIWKLWKTDVHLEQIINDWFCIAWSAKWLYSDRTMGNVLTPKEIQNEDDKRIMVSLWKLINEADIVVSHNGNKFDIPRINSRFIINGLSPTKPYFSVDTCQIARRQFGFSSNKLDALATHFNIPHKLETNFDLWKRCLNGDKKALQYMLKYNKKDVTILEEVYLKLRPWIKNHPNMGNLGGEQDVCCNCGSDDISIIDNRFYYTSVGKYPLFRCNQCHAVSRGRKKINESPNTASISH